MEQILKFLVYVGAIALVYVAQTCFKIKQTRKSGDFSWKALLDGLIDHLIYFIGAFALLCSGLLLPDMKVSVIGGMELTTIDVMFMLVMALYIKQTNKAFNNFKDNYELDVDIQPYNDGNGVEK